MKKLQFLVLIFFLGIMSCSKTDDLLLPFDDDVEGNFEVTISGSEKRMLTGTSSFVQAIHSSDADDDNNGTTLAINMYSQDDDSEVISLFIHQPGNKDGINTGSYTLNLDDDNGLPIVNATAVLRTSLTAFLGSSGKVQISKSMDRAITGSISVSLDNLNGELITISGDFNSSGVTQKN